MLDIQRTVCGNAFYKFAEKPCKTCRICGDIEIFTFWGTLKYAEGKKDLVVELTTDDACTFEYEILEKFARCVLRFKYFQFSKKYAKKVSRFLGNFPISCTYDCCFFKGSIEFMKECTTIEYPFALHDIKKGTSQLG